MLQISMRFGIAVTLLSLAGLGLAKPMLPPTPEQAVESPLVLVTDYVSHDAAPTPTYFGGTIAEYQVRTVLKGQFSDKTIRIRYEFHDGTPCMEEPGWNFSDKLMPKPNSQWILFLRPGEKAEDPYRTYRGDYGRWGMNEVKLQTVQGLLKK